NGIDPETIPIVLQHNKRDLGDVLPEAELNRLFQWRDDIASFPSVATENQGVFETFVHTMGMLIQAKIGQYGLDRRGVEASSVAEGVRAKLWDIYDQYRGMIATEPDRMIELTVPESAEADEPSSSRSEIFADDDLKIDLGADESGVHESGEVSEPIEDAGLLEQTIDSNVQLAEQFGALDEYRNLLERKNTELVHIAQNTVHDLNRPLAAISLLLSSMEKGYLGDLNQSMRAGVENGIEAVAMMSRLIGDLIDSSRLDFQGVEFEFGSVDISEVIEDVLGTLRYEIEENSIRMQVESLPSILGDEWMLKRLFLNLLGNAVLYSDPGVDSVIRVHSYEEEDRSVFVIEDNGIGIPEQDLPRLFRRFERGSNTAGVSGSGLGLHIVKEVVAGHGGTVWVESTEGVGSRFMVGIPRQPVQAPHSSVSETAEIADL
ncbi:MAG: HAMP domain-containing sensor histidine kinase, partial [Planctomycetota bacterium]|nr:HAMP domain-containing sensor histidine kinase [Planctomycetota bacterium]